MHWEVGHEEAVYGKVDYRISGGAEAEVAVKCLTVVDDAAQGTVAMAPDRRSRTGSGEDTGAVEGQPRAVQSDPLGRRAGILWLRNGGLSTRERDAAALR